MVTPVTVVNNGPSYAQNTVVTVTLAPSTTFNPGATVLPSGWYSQLLPGGIVVITTSVALTPDTPIDLPIVVDVAAGVVPGTSLQFNGTTSSTTSDPDTTNNTATTPTSVVRKATLKIAKTSNPATVTAGELVTYTITITNEGPSDARFVDVKEQLPSGLTLQSIAASDGGACAGTLCQFGTVAYTTTRTITVVARVGSDVTGVVTNTAAVDSVDNATGLPVSTTATTTITTRAVLTMTKTALNEPVQAGGLALYEIVVRNLGPSDAQDVVVTDTLPVSTTYAGGDAACVANGTEIVCTLGMLAAGAIRTLLVQVNVSQHIVAGTVITNAAVAGSPTAPLTTTAAATNTVAQPADGVADVQINKDGPATVTAGERITYTLVVTNRGPASAQDVQVVDALPVGVSYVSATATQGTCAGAVNCQLGDLALNATATVTIVGLVDSAVVSGTVLTNLAQVNSANEDPLSANNTDIATTTVEQLSNISMSKHAVPATATAGSALVYQIVVTNAGPSVASGVVVSDVLPAGFVLSSVSSSQGSCTSLPCPVGDIAARATVVVTIRGAVEAGHTGALVNLASITATTPLTGTTDATLTTAVSTTADLALVLASTPTVFGGESAVVTPTVVNNGPSYAQNTVVTVTLAPSTTFNPGATVLPSGWYSSVVNGFVVLTTTNPLTPDTPIDLPIVVDVAPGVLPGTSLQFNGTTSSTTSDPDTTNNTANADTSVVRKATLKIAKTSAPATVTAGELVTYTITITNEGPSDARFVDVKEQLPSGLTLQSIVASDGGACAGTLCQFGTVTQHATRTISVVARVGSDVTGVVTNTAAVDSVDNATGLPVSTTATTTITTGAKLRLEKTALNQIVNAGETLLYQIVVANDGPSTAQTVRITDTLPAYLTFVGGDAACTASGQTVTCDVGALAAGATRTLLFQARANILTPDGVSVTNLVTATSPTAATVVATATATIVQPAAGATDLIISKDGPATAVAGAQIVYTLVVTNLGPATASGVQVVDAIPGELTATAVRSTQGTCNKSVICQLGALAAGAAARIVITAAVHGDVLTGTQLVNVAQVGSANPDPMPLNNTADQTTTVQALARLHIDKLASPAVAAPGGQIAYRIVVTNSGPSLAHAVVVTDLLPVQVLNPFVSSSQGGCTGFPCALGDLPVGAAATILVAGVVAPDAVGSFVNVAQAGSDALGGGAVVTATAAVTVQPLADVVLAKQATPTAVAGLGVGYTLTVRNNGPSAAAAVVVTDTLPAGVSAMAAPGCAIDGATVVCAVGSLAAGAERAFFIAGNVDANLPPGASLENRAVATSVTPDPDPANNQASADTSILRVADLALAKQGPATVVAGENATYVITVVNNGPSAASVRDLKDTLPPGMSLVDASLATASGDLTACASGICQMAQPLPVGAVATMTVVARVDAATVPGSAVTNTATVLPETNSTDPNLTNNLGQVASVVAELASLRIDKFDLVDPVEPDGVVAYVIVVTNTGPSDARGVVIHDTLPPNVTFQSSTGGCTEAPAGLLTCNLGQVAAGQHVAIQVYVRVSRATPSGAVLHNSVTLTATTPLTNALLTADEDTLVVARPGVLADLEVQKHAPTPIAQAGGLVTFTIVVTNHGPSPATNVQLYDVLPNGLSLVSTAASQGFCETGINCTLGTLDFQADARGLPIFQGTATITVVARVLASLQSAVVLTNTVYVDGDQQDPLPENNLDTASVSTVAQYTDLRILKEAAAVVANGSLLTYTLLAINDGPAAAYDVTVRDPLPLGVTYVDATPAPAGGLPGAPFWQLGVMAAGEQRSIVLAVRVDPGAGAGILLQNTASITTTTPELSLANNMATVTTQGFAQADVAIAKSTAISYALPGEVVTYTVVVTNYGPSTATEVDVKELLPPGMTPIDLTPGQGVCVSQICQLGDVPVGGAVTITVTATADGSVAPGTVLTNTAAVFTGTPDPNPDNNIDTAPITAGPVVTLAALKLAEAPTATVGSLITYTVIVTNLGPSLAPQIVVTDNTPAGFQFVAGTAVNGCVAVDPAHVVCDAGPLPAGQALRYQLVFYIVSASPGMVKNVIVATAPGADDPSGGATSEAEIEVKPTPTAITLVNYDLFPQEDGLLIVWQTTAEYATTWGFNLWRGTTANRDAAVLLNQEIIPARGAGSSYNYLDRTTEPGVTYWYWLQEVTADGLTADYGVVSGRMPGPGWIFLPLVASGARARAVEAEPIGGSIYLPLVTENGGAAKAADAIQSLDPAPTQTPTPTPPLTVTPTDSPVAPPTAAPTVAPSPAEATPTPVQAATPTATVTLPAATAAAEGAGELSPTSIPLSAPTPLPTSTPEVIAVPSTPSPE